MMIENSVQMVSGCEVRRLYVDMMDLVPPNVARSSTHGEIQWSGHVLAFERPAIQARYEYEKSGETCVEDHGHSPS